MFLRLRWFVKSGTLHETCMYGCLTTCWGALLRVKFGMHTCLDVKYSGVPSMVFINAAIANACPCLFATFTNWSILLSCTHVTSVTGVYTALAHQDSPLAKLAMTDLKCPLSTVLHKAWCGCNTKPDEIYALYNMVTPVWHIWQSIRYAGNHVSCSA